LLEQAGMELAPFDPLVDKHFPEGCSGLYAGGGFPEVYAHDLADNRPLLDEIRNRVAAGMPTWAECGGLLLLCESLDGVPMTGALPGVKATMNDRLSLGYRRATTRTASIFGPPGTELRAHEFHRTVTDPTGDALETTGRTGIARTGFSSPTLFASYLHQHLSATPHFAEVFAQRVSASASSPDPASMATHVQRN
jgi:cobyrinic acid a,c-diamide synthase